METQTVFLVTVLCLGIGAQWAAWRLKLPAILLLLVIGFALGQVDLGQERAFDADHIVGKHLLFSMVSLAVSVILFEGGLSLRFRELKETSGTVTRLVSIAILVTWVFSTVAAKVCCGLDWPLASVLGAILVVSGPTVVIPLLRHVRPVRKLASIVKWEGIVNDPIGAVLAVLVFEAVIVTEGFQEAALHTAFSVILVILIGVLGGAAVAFSVVQLLKRHWIPDYLENAILLATIMAS
ncbi:MAG: cation:proton antiporter, partial [Planctomycetales bacterium]